MISKDSRDTRERIVTGDLVAITIQNKNGFRLERPMIYLGFKESKYSVLRHHVFLLWDGQTHEMSGVLERYEDIRILSKFIDAME